MAADYEVLAQIEVLLKGQQDAQRRMEQLEAATNKAGAAATKTGSSLQAMGAAFLATLSATLVAGFVRSSVTAFASLERQVNVLRGELEGLGIDAAANIPRVVNFLRQLESAGGAQLGDSINGFRRFVSILGDVDTALYATQLASNAAADGTRTMDASVAALAAMLQGNVVQAAKAFDIKLEDINGKQKDASKLAEEVTSKLAGLGGGMNDTTGAIARNASAWEDLKRVVGEFGGSFLKQLDEWGIGLRTFVQGLEQYLLNARKAWAGTTAFFKALIEGDFTNAFARAGKASADVWVDNLVKTSAGRKVDAEKAAAAIIEAAGVATRRQSQKEADKLAAQAKKDAERLAKQRAELEQEASDELLRRQIEAAEKGSRERERLEVRMLERVRDRALAAANKVGAETVDLERGFQLAISQVHDEYAEGREEKARRLLEKAIEAREDALRRMSDIELEAAEDDRARFEEVTVKQIEAERDYLLNNFILTEEEKAQAAEYYERIIARIRKKFREEDLDDARKTAQQSIDLQAAIATAALSIANGLFGESKALAIAEAIINAWLGYSKALATVEPPPLAWAMAAVSLAKGFEAVRNIQRADKTRGAGFDDPVNDRLAYMGGRRWAEDMIRLVSAGLSDRMSEFVGPGVTRTTTTNNYRDGDMVVNVHGNLYGGNAGMRDLRRQLDVAYRRDAARRVNR